MKTGSSRASVFLGGWQRHRYVPGKVLETGIRGEILPFPPRGIGADQWASGAKPSTKRKYRLRISFLEPGRFIVVILNVSNLPKKLNDLPLLPALHLLQQSGFHRRSFKECLPSFWASEIKSSSN